jgi:hypothetical protein
MKTPDEAQLLNAWEQGFDQTLQVKAFKLFELARPDLTESQALGMSVGSRDSTLIDFRRRIFGRSADVVATCTSCNEQFEATLDLAEMQFGNKLDASDPFHVELEGYSLLLRTPRVVDLISLSKDDDKSAIRENILSNCIITAMTPANELANPRTLPNSVKQLIDQRLASHDSAADITLEFSCPHCEKHSSQIFDIVTLLVKEVQNWARGMLQDIHALARAYGWSEDSILSMSAARRQTYIDLVSQ